MRLKKLGAADTNSQLANLMEHLERSLMDNPNQLTDQFLVFCRAVNIGDINADNIQTNNNVIPFWQVMRLIQSTSSHPLHAKFDSLLAMLPEFVQKAYRDHRTPKNKSNNDTTNIDLLITKLGILSQLIEDENVGFLLAFCYGLKSGSITNSPQGADSLGHAFHALFNLEVKLNQTQSELITIIKECKELLPLWVRESYQTIVENLTRQPVQDSKMAASAPEPEQTSKRSANQLYPYKIIGNTISVTGQFDNNAILKFFSLCATENLEPNLTRKADGFSLGNIAGKEFVYERLLVRFFAPTLVLVDPATVATKKSTAVANNMRFSTNSDALRGANPASIAHDDIKSRNPFNNKPGKSIFIPGKINDVMMIQFETQCFNFGLTPEYHLTHDGCFISDVNSDEQNLTNYAIIMKGIMLDRNPNSFMAGV